MQMSRTLEVFTIKRVNYTDQYGFERSETVKDQAQTITMTDRTKDSKYYEELIKAPIAVDEDGVEYIGSVATDFGPSHQAWITENDGDTKIWYSRYSGTVGVMQDAVTEGATA